VATRRRAAATVAAGRAGPSDAIARTRQALGAPAFDVEAAAGRAMSREQAIVFGLVD
jgi:hypothetical protein